jgi:hexokinase
MVLSEKTAGFLSRHRLLASQYSAKDIIAAFLGEMDKGLSGAESSLAMIPSFIPIPQNAPKNEKIIVLDAGGTNFRTAIIRFDENSVPHKEYFANNSMPGIEKELGKEDFFNLIADYIKPVLKESNRLGFCFSYPALIDRDRDGTLLYWTKEVKAPAVVGQKILANIAATLKKRGLPCPEHMDILNDTVASLLAGVTATRFSQEYSYIGFILGTGSNTAYIERNGNIKKEMNLPPAETMAINCESANFNKIDRGDIDIAFDKTTASPGKYVLEKMVSGGYLGSLCMRILECAAQEGLLSAETRQKLGGLDSSNAKYVSSIVAGQAAQLAPLAGCAAADLETMRAVLDAVVDRAALLTAINMSSPIVKSVRDHGSRRKYCISADGTVYYKLHSLRQRAENYLAEILKPHGVEHRIVKIDEAPIIGTAVAGLV